MHRAHHSRRATAGVAALLPALLLAALYVAAPFAGTNTHAISYRTPLRAAAAAPASHSGHGKSQQQARQQSQQRQQDQQRAANAPVPLAVGTGTAWTLILGYAGAVLVALVVIGWLAARVTGRLDRVRGGLLNRLP